MTRLRPKRVDRKALVELYLRGSYNACLAGCHNDEDARNGALQARVLIRVGKFGDALEAVNRDVCDENNAIRGEYASLRSLGSALLGRFDDASEAQRDARAYLYSVDEPALEAELHVNEAKLALIRGDAVAARRLACRVQFESFEYLATRDFEVTSVAIAHAEANNLLSMIDMAEGDRTSAVCGLIKSLELLSSSKPTDVGLIARQLANLSGSLQGIDADLEQTSRQLLRSYNSTIAWTEDLSSHQFYTIRELGLASALDGDHLSAFREYKAAFNVAPRRPLKLLALLDRVFLGRELKQTLVAHADLLEAQELAVSIDWSNVEDRDFFCLLPLATLLAPIDCVAANWAVLKYAHRKAKSTQTSSQFSDPTFQGDYLMAVAAIARAEHRRKDAVRASTSAFEIFDGLGIRWRAAQAAYDLRETGDRFREYAMQEAARYPSSWLASKIGTTAN